MSIKFAVLRTQDGHATDPLRPDANVAPGVAGHFEILTTDKADAVRVSIDGVECQGGRMPRWTADRQPGSKAQITIEQIAAGKTIDTATGVVGVRGDAPADVTPEAPQTPEPPTE